MSHFTRLRTQIAEKDTLIQALQDLGYTVEEGPVEIGGFAGNRMKVELKVPTRSAGFDIGFRKVGGFYEVVADWWGIRELNRDRFAEALAQRYAYRAARAKLEAQGFALVEEEKSTSGQVRLLLRRVA